MTNLLDKSTLQADIREVATIFHHIYKSTDTNTPKGKLTFKYTPKTINVFMNDVHIRRFLSGQFHISAISNLCTYLTGSELVKTSGYWRVISTTNIADKKMVVYSTPDDDISIQYDGIEVRRIVNPEYDYQDIIEKIIAEYKEYYENQEKSRKVSATFTRKVSYVMAMAAIQYLEPRAKYSTTNNDLEIIVEVREKNLIEVVNAIGSCNPIKC